MDLIQSQLRRLLWYLIGGSRGGANRAQLVRLVKERPMNANWLSKELKLDYKTVEYHLRVLEKNKLLVSEGGYGAVYSLSPLLEQNFLVFEEIWGKVNIPKKGLI